MKIVMKFNNSYELYEPRTALPDGVFAGLFAESYNPLYPA